MTQLLDDTSCGRALPVLVKIAAQLDRSPGDPLPVSTLITQLADVMDAADVTRAVVALADEGLVETTALDCRPASEGRQIDRIMCISSEAHRVVDLWRSAESALDQMIAILEEIEADSGTSEDERGRARKMLYGLLLGGRDLGVAVMVAAINQQARLHRGQVPTPAS